jgi:hypothetical protein
MLHIFFSNFLLKQSENKKYEISTRSFFIGKYLPLLIGLVYTACRQAFC